MHNELTSRIAVLLSAADHGDMLELKSQLFDLAKLCQITLDQTRLIGETCGAFDRPISALFGCLGLLCLLTEPKRRQVYFAVIEAIETDQTLDAITQDAEARNDLLTRLFTASNEALITFAYESCPKGFVALLGRLGEQARAPGTYRRLFKLLDSHDTLADALLTASQDRMLDDDLIELMTVLPPTAIGVKAAMRFGTISNYHRFMRPYAVMMQLSEISDVHLRQIANGTSPSKLINRLYLRQPFPDPVLNAPDLVHIANGHMLERTAKRFSNCLADYLPLALTNRRQFYLWHQRQSDSEMVLAISNDQPFGWYLSEARLAQNKRLTQQQRDALKTLLQQHSVRVGGSLRYLMMPFHDYAGDDEEIFDLEQHGIRRLDALIQLDDVA